MMVDSTVLAETAAASTAPGASDEDRELARRCARGDELALRLVFEAHEPSLRRLLFRIVRDMSDAEELSADVFVRFWKSAGRFRGDCSLRAYLTRIALNLGRDRLRRRRVITQSVVAEEANPLMPDIEEGMSRLEPADREILTLYYLDELAYEEIAAALGITYDVLRTRLVRARKRLRALLGVDQ
jgi:RNA polymerase sigma-70 factor, ECF subfamily